MTPATPQSPTSTSKSSQPKPANSRPTLTLDPTQTTNPKTGSLPRPAWVHTFLCHTSDGTSDRTRTCNLRGRSSLLYPVELRRQINRTPSAATRYTHCLTPVRASAKSGVGMVGVASVG